MRYIYLLFILISISAFAHRENSYFLYGTIGSKEIGMRIDDFENVCFARFFRIDGYNETILNGTISDKLEYKLFKDNYDSLNRISGIKETYILKEDTGYLWNGKVIYEDGHEESIFLKPLNTYSIKHNYYNIVRKYKMDPYLTYYTRNIVFEKQNTEKISKGKKIRWYIEPVSEVKHFRVINNQADTLNEFLIYEHLLQVIAHNSCIYSDKKEKYHFNCNITYINNNWISYQYKITSGCNGIIDENYTQFYCRNLKNASVVMLEDILWFSKEEQINMREGDINWFKYRYKIFGEVLLQLVKESYPDKLETNVTNSCKYNDKSIWQFPDWYLTNKGICFKSNFSNSGTYCKNPLEVEISWDNLKNYLVNH